ncbi:hypothetical protein BD779DRAFT_1566768 [Infundibulicybe gibba]|nr:hypothetical protein BD779DRAFT_1566768 [Infundibulicybe gibba]
MFRNIIYAPAHNYARRRNFATLISPQHPQRYLGLRKAVSLQLRHFGTDLGVRSQSPPDSIHPSDPEGPPEISDQEWEIRTGRAIYILQHTLPDFFTHGLTTSFDKLTGTPRISSSIHIPIANTTLFDHDTANDNVETIYSPKVRLSYTPPTALPAPFPQVLHIEGIPLYMASSAFVRHTLNALYSDLRVVLRRVAVNGPGSPQGRAATSEIDEPALGHASGGMKIREKSLFVGLSVTGVARVSGSPGEWQVDSTYTFSPLTGLIHTHTVDSIHPAPHQAVYDSLRLSLGKVFGFGLEGSPRADGAACRVRTAPPGGGSSSK